MYKTEKVAILLATYNGEKYLADQLDSIIGQTFTEWELFIHDDGSNDNTLEIIEKYNQLFPNKIHILEGKGTGSAKNNFFFLMKKIDAPYIMFCDQDDIWLSNKIEQTYNRMKKVENKSEKRLPILVFSDLKVVNQDLLVLSERMSSFQKLDSNKIQFKDVLIQNIVTGCTVMINNSCLRKSIVITNSDKIIMHDWWCALVASYFGIVSYIDEPLILYRQHDDNSVGAKALIDPKYMLSRIFKFGEMKENVIMTRRQAAVFSDCFHLDSNSIPKQYSMLSSKGKMRRIQFYIKNNMWKSGLLRNLGFLVFG